MTDQPTFGTLPAPQGSVHTRSNPSRDRKGGRPPKDGKVTNCNLKKGCGNDRVLARLARDNRDDLLDAIESGDMSVNQAAIAAGYRKKLTEGEKCVRAFCKAENQAELLRTLHAILDETN